MTNHLVEGRLLPDAVAGHTALELCNTKAMWGLPSEREYLVDFATLVLWAREHAVITPAEARRLRAGLLTAAQQRAALTRVCVLRAAVFTVVTAKRPAAAELATINGFVARAAGRSAYVPDGSALRLHPPLRPGVLADRLALEVHRLLEDFGPEAVGLCAAPVCGWVFLDPTHRRRWCTMAGCGNRAKARRHASRRRDPR